MSVRTVTAHIDDPMVKATVEAVGTASPGIHDKKTALPLAFNELYTWCVCLSDARGESYTIIDDAIYDLMAKTRHSTVLHHNLV